MQYWTKNGSIPSTETDGTEGWQPAQEPPTDVPADKELVWLNWEWIIRDPKPADRAGWQWNWQHEGKMWVESPWGNYKFLNLNEDLSSSDETILISNSE